MNLECWNASRGAGTRLGWLVSTWMVGLVAAGCNLDLKTPDLSDLGRITICDGMTLGELIDAATLSEGCKASLGSHLPEPNTNFESKLVVLGSEEGEDGSLTVYAHGADAAGQALQATAWAGVEVRVRVSGTIQLLAEGEFSVSLVGELPADLLSVGIVNDYSGSMSEDDLETVAEIETDLLTYLPPVYEAEVTQFSSEVAVKQAFTTDRDALLDAVGYDVDFDRQLTALYDGMGTGLDSLLAQERPLRLLVVSTDGRENASEQYTKDELIDTIADRRVVVLMLGALLARPSDLRELAGPRGVYFYTPYYRNARAQLEQYLQSLTQLMAITIPPEHRGDGPVMLAVDGAEGEI